MMMNSIITKVRGVSQPHIQENVKVFACKDIGSFALVREPNNPHDPNAIAVKLGNLLLGYVPKEIAKDLAPQIDSGIRFIGFFEKRNESPFHDTVGFTIRIQEVEPVEIR
ncbi:MAG: HIRAN domain-containing protein [Deltaproteobacteria bacterium]|nr:HIRAN domain-containing protein [Deltaproteobacteria bacterium]